MDVDRLRPIAKRVTPVQIDVLPGHRGNVLKQSNTLNVPGCLLILQEAALLR